MNVAILIFEPPGWQFGEVRRAFRAEADPRWAVHLVSSSDELLQTLTEDSHEYVVVLPDRLEHGQAAKGERSGLALVPRIRQFAPAAAVVVVAEEGNVGRAAEAIAAGATDFVVLGGRLRQRIATLLGKLRGLLEVMDRNRRLHQDNAQLRQSVQARLRIVGRSPQIQRLLDQIQRVAQVPRPVLIVGERGTGKELVARAIHYAAGPPTRPMVTVNCAAFGDALLESELFGHEKGAFTGAEAVHYGSFEQADGGTLFLDEIGHMSLPFQEKVLRVVEYGTFTRVGGSTEHKTSARIIAATNRDLKEQIRSGEFLADLYDRLTFETIEVPPLREREGDVEVLARFFLDQFARETPALGRKSLSPAAIAVLKSYRFPGNVRELKNLVERAAYRDTGGEITPEDLGLLPEEETVGPGGSFRARMRAFGRRLILDALQQSGGNQAQAARGLGLPYHQFRYYHKKYVGKERWAGSDT
jgi:DNA-binding NtrC family response regulator